MHVNVIHKKGIWSTRKNRSCKLPEITLAYFGKNTFYDTKEIEMLSAPTHASDFLIPDNAFKREVEPVGLPDVPDIKVKTQCEALEKSEGLIQYSIVK